MRCRRELLATYRQDASTHDNRRAGRTTGGALGRVPKDKTKEDYEEDVEGGDGCEVNRELHGEKAKEVTQQAVQSKRDSLKARA